MRYALDPMGWGSQSSQIFESRQLRWGSQLFHWGIILVFFGHIAGLLVPIGVYRALGVSSAFYHLNAEVMGGITGLAAWTGIVILAWRRGTNRRVRRHSRKSDGFVLVLLWLVVTTGLLMTLVYPAVKGLYEYRVTVGPWIRGLLIFDPNAQLMVHVPLILKIHILLSLVFFGVFPFTRLVHIWSVPLAYLRRAPIQYRARTSYRKSS